MIWNSWSDFFAMGGYGLYVWGSFIVVLLCMLGEVAFLLQRWGATRQRLTRFIKLSEYSSKNER